MRQIILTFLLFVALGYSLKPQINVDSSIDPYIFEDLINETIQSLISNIVDPLEVDAFEINLPDEPDAIIAGNGTISNLKLSGLQDVQVPSLNFEIIGVILNFTVGLKSIDFYTDFHLNFKLADTLAIYGVGNVTVHFDDLEIKGSAQANLTGGIQVENLRLQIQIGKATFDIHGLEDDEDLSDLLSSILNDLAVKLIDENQELITQIVSPIAEGIINSILTSLLAPTTTPPDVTVGLN